MKISQWIEEFELYLIAAKRRRSTITQYRRQLTWFAEYMESIGIERPEKITRAAVRHWAADMSNRWKDASLRQAVIMVKKFLRFIADEGVPMENLDGAIVLPRVRDVPHRTLTAQEIKDLLEFIESLDDSPQKYRLLAMVSLMIDSGLRASEVCSLRVDDVNVEDGVLRVEGKGGDWGRAFFGARTSRALKLWLEVREKWLRERDREDPGTVFISLGGKKSGSPLTPDGLRSIIRKLGEDAGIPGISPHVFRRSFATFSVLYYGVPTRVVQVMGRWSSVLMVEKYTKVLDDPNAVDSHRFGQYTPLDKLLGDESTSPGEEKDDEDNPIES